MVKKLSLTLCKETKVTRQSMLLVLTVNLYKEASMPLIEGPETTVDEADTEEVEEIIVARDNQRLAKNEAIKKTKIKKEEKVVQHLNKTNDQEEEAIAVGVVAGEEVEVTEDIVEDAASLATTTLLRTKIAEITKVEKERSAETKTKETEEMMIVQTLVEEDAHADLDVAQDVPHRALVTKVKIDLNDVKTTTLSAMTRSVITTEDREGETENLVHLVKKARNVKEEMNKNHPMIKQR